MGAFGRESKSGSVLRMCSIDELYQANLLDDEEQVLFIIIIIVVVVVLVIVI